MDKDTQDVPGAPGIAQTIFDKIDKAGIVLADVSLVATRDGAEKKRSPNPNVLLELGYAASVLGWDRIILVMNDHFGISQELPFDLAHRRHPFHYSMSPDASNAEIPRVRAALCSQIKSAIRACNEAEHRAVVRAIERLDANAIPWMKNHAYNNYFSAPERKMQGDILGSQRVDHALVRLIDVGLLRFDISAAGEMYAYHWTYLGKLVLRQLKFWLPVSVVPASRDGSRILGENVAINGSWVEFAKRHSD